MHESYGNSAPQRIVSNLGVEKSFSMRKMATNSSTVMTT